MRNSSPYSKFDANGAKHDIPLQEFPTTNPEAAFSTSFTNLENPLLKSTNNNCNIVDINQLPRRLTNIYSDSTNTTKSTKMETTTEEHIVPLESTDKDALNILLPNNPVPSGAKHPRKFLAWKPYLIAAVDCLFGAIVVLAALSGAIFDFQPHELIRFRHDIFLIYGAYGLFIFLFSCVGIAAVKKHSKNLFRIFLIWKQCSIPFSIAVCAFVILLEVLNILDPLDFCLTKRNCTTITCLIIAAVGVLSLIASVIGLLVIRSYMTMERVERLDARSRLLQNRKSRRASGVDDTVDINNGLIPVNLPGYPPASPFRVAASKFNHKPESSIEYLLVNNIIENTPEAIANFLFSTETLNLRKIGDWISEPKARNQQVLKAFADIFDFTGLSFDDALRTFLSKFRLPGEAQKIDRIMEAFAKRFCTCNKQLGVFPSSDTAYILAFALIMLNTDAHNTAIKSKMTKRQFLHNNRGIANGKQLYDNIINNEIKLDEDEIFGRPEKKGWLRKLGRNGRWQRHWFIVANHCLYYFNAEEDKDPRVIIPLEGLSFRENMTEFNDRACFEIFTSNSTTKIKSVKLGPEGPKEGQHDRFVFEVENQDELDDWLDALEKNIVASPFLQLINFKKQKIAQQAKKN